MFNWITASLVGIGLYLPTWILFARVHLFIVELSGGCTTLLDCPFSDFYRDRFLVIAIISLCSFGLARQHRVVAALVTASAVAFVAVAVVKP